MSQEWFQTDELDEATLAYLTAARAGGETLPGVRVPGSGLALPIGGVIVGLILVGVGLFGLGFGGDPLKTAMLQAAFLLPGGWMALAGVRTMIDRGSPLNLGHFTFVDPVYVWDVQGRSVGVTPLGRVVEANGTHNLENGAYQNTAVVVRRDGEPDLKLTLNHQLQAERAVIFLNIVAEAGRRAAEAGGGPPPAALGAIARDMAAAGSDLPDDFQPALTVEAIPEPQRAHPPRGGWLVPTFVIAAVAAALIAVLVPVNTSARDDALFEAVKNGRPPELRLYLLDPKNTRHRPDVQLRLDSHYETALNTFKARQKLPPDLLNGLTAVLDSAKKATQPIITLGFVEKPGPLAVPAADREAVLNDLGEKLVAALGPDLVAFARPPADKEPMVRVACTKAEGGAAAWEVTFQPPDAGDAIYRTETKPVPAGVDGWKRAALEVFGVAPPPAAAAPRPVPGVVPGPNPGQRRLEDILRDIRNREKKSP